VVSGISSFPLNFAGGLSLSNPAPTATGNTNPDGSPVTSTPTETPNSTSLLQAFTTIANPNLASGQNSGSVLGAYTYDSSFFGSLPTEQSQLLTQIASHAKQQFTDLQSAIQSTYQQKADTITAEVLMAVRRSFITPFDRGDIKDLINAMDDSIDQMQKTAKAITIFEVETFQPQMRAIGDLVVRASKLIAEAIALLGSMKMNAARLNAITEEVIKLEGESDDLHDQGIKALFKGPGQASPMEYIVGNEIYDHLEKVLDRFEDVANRVSGILIESV